MNSKLWLIVSNAEDRSININICVCVYVFMCVNMFMNYFVKYNVYTYYIISMDISTSIN